MGTLSYTNTIANGDPADGDEVMANFNDAKAVINGGISEINLANGAVTTTKIGAVAVDGTKIADNSIENSHMADDSVDTAEIVDLAVDTAQLAADAVDGTKIEDDAVDTEHIADLAVDTAQIAASAVETAKINDDAVTDAKLEYTIASSGAKVQRVGPASTKFGTEGIIKARCQTSVSAPQSTHLAVTIQISGGSSDAIDGDPKFEYVDTTLSNYPHLEGWGYYSTAADTAVNVPIRMGVLSFANSGGYITTITVHLDFASAGPSATGGTLYTTWSGRTDSTT